MWNRNGRSASDEQMKRLASMTSKNGLARIVGLTVPALQRRLAVLSILPDALLHHPSGKEPGWLFAVERIPELRDVLLRSEPPAALDQSPSVRLACPPGEDAVAVGSLKPPTGAGAVFTEGGKP